MAERPVLCAELLRRSDTATAGRLTVRVHVHSDAKRMAAGASVPAETSDFPEPPASRERWTIYDAIKRGLDLIGSLALLAMLTPLLLIIAAAIKLRSRGPVFFEQERVGEKMKPFRMLKFRTMHTGADSAIHHQFVTQFITSGAQAQDGGAAGVFKLTHDPRVTPIGRFLRKTSLDELPQLVNVLRGDMSLVGPRPPLKYELEQYKPWHCHRVLDAKPGSPDSGGHRAQPHHVRRHGASTSATPGASRSDRIKIPGHARRGAVR